MKASMVIKNIGMLATPVGNTARVGAAQGEISMLAQAWLALDGETILAVGQGDSYPEAQQVVDAEGALVTPGLIDAHTHLVFGGWREHELALKLAGVPYLEILKQGGGIMSTVEKTRASSSQELLEKSWALLNTMLALGVTCCEVKSGYGLSTEQELKQLRVIQELDKMQPVELVATFLGAHAYPAEFQTDHAGYIRLVIDEMLPAVVQEQLAEYCDVFCESGVFSPAESREILQAAQKLGLKAKIHADEIDPLGGSELAGALGAVSGEHLIATSDAGIAALAAANTVAVLLPGTSFYLDKPFARARAMMDAGVAVAVATDFNPGSCPGISLQLAMNLACYKYRMSPPEVLTAVTLNAAAAVNRADRLGSLEAGKQADFVIWDAPNLNYLLYRFGGNLASQVYVKGNRVAGK